MDDALIWFAMLSLIGGVAFVYLRFGKSAAVATGALGALILAYLKGRAGAKQYADEKLKEKEAADAIVRDKEVRKADTAADAVRDDVRRDPERLREHDPFERR